VGTELLAVNVGFSIAATTLEFQKTKQRRQSNQTALASGSLAI
jgi:hypothetical protein